MYATMQSFCSFFVFIKKSWMDLMICVFFIHATPPTYPTYCNICLMELICVNDSNAKKIIIHLNYIFLLWIFKLGLVSIYFHKWILYRPCWYMDCLIDLFQQWVCAIVQVVVNCGLNVCGSCL
jgi:hypothetical protein